MKYLRKFNSLSNYNIKSTKWTATGVSSIPAGWTIQTAAS